MALSSLLRHPITIYKLIQPGTPPVNEPPGFADDEPKFTGGTAALAYVEPHQAKEFDMDRETRLTDYDVYLMPDADVEAVDEIEWNNVRHIIIGRPKLWSRPAGPHHLLLTMRAVEG